MYLSKLQNVFVQIELFYQEESVKDCEASEDVDEAGFEVHLLLLHEDKEANDIS